MRQFLTYLLLVVFASVITGCAKSAEQALSMAGIVDAATTPAPTSVLATPTSLLPTPEITPPAPAQTSLPVEMPFPEPLPILFDNEGKVIPITPVPEYPFVACAPQGDVVLCRDRLLDMDFSYPAFMGQLLSTSLRKGGYSGFAYNYSFSNRHVNVGGRSHDFSEGRGGIPTDYFGFKGRSAEEICAGSQNGMCLTFGHGIVMQVVLPKAEWLCGNSMMYPTPPRVDIRVDLPEHPLVNGLIFIVPLISEQEYDAVLDRWIQTDFCDSETAQRLDAEMAQLRKELPAGTADAEFQQRYDTMIRFAESIISPYVAPNP